MYSSYNVDVEVASLKRVVPKIKDKTNDTDDLVAIASILNGVLLQLTFNTNLKEVWNR